ncbi:MAG: hypothetical protein C0404_02855 [Verrucomicrobia bacterium]|nr:hypothetical protein [Verrucomicrobiota bacterium]
MKIVQIVPGSGDSFYCENCVRDTALVKALRRQGHDVILLPMYLPLTLDDPNIHAGTPVFYGAINTYLKEKVPAMRRAPRFVEKMLDSPGLLEWAAAKAGSTRAQGLEEMTLSILRGDQGNQARELDRMVDWLEANSRPEIIHLSNSMLLGLAAPLKKRLRVPVVCSLQDEDGWINAMDPEKVELVWKTMSEKAADADAFIAVSRYYADLMVKQLSIPRDKMNVVHVGIDLDGYDQAPLNFRPPTIGYLSRLTESLGLGFLVEAFLRLKADPELKHIRLRGTGGMTKDDEAFIALIEKRVQKMHWENDIDFVAEFDRRSRQRFIQTLSVMCVPSPAPVAFATHSIEAMACGVPVVEPELGAYPEIIEATGGGLLYDPNDMGMLEESLSRILSDPKYAAELGRKGRKAVHADFGIDTIAARMVSTYEAVRKAGEWWDN